MLISCVRNNQKAGWKKHRTTVGEAFQGLYSDLGLSALALNAQVPSTAEPFPPAHVADFSSQLVTLRGALGTSKPVTAQPAAALVSVGSAAKKPVSV